MTKKEQSSKPTFRTLIINLYYQLLLCNIFNHWLYTLICICELYFIITFSICLTKSSNLHDIIVEFTLVNPFVKSISLQSFYIFMTVISCIHILLPIIVILWLSDKTHFNEKEMGYISEYFLKALSMYIQLLLRVFSLLLYYFYFYLFLCPSNDSCWTGEHLLYSLIALLGMGCVILIVTISDYFFVSDCYPDSPRPWAGTLSRVSLFRTATKLILAFSFASEISYGAIGFVLYLYFAYQRTTCQQIMYNKLVLITVMSSDMIIGIFGLDVTISTLLNEELTIFNAFLMILVTLVLSLASITNQRLVLEKTIELPIDKLKDSDTVVIQFIKLIEAFNDNFKSSAERHVILVALTNHRESCSDLVNCNCVEAEKMTREVCKLFATTEVDHLSKIKALRLRNTLLKQIVSILLQDALKISGDNLYFRLLASYIEDQKLDNYIKGYFNIMQAEKYSQNLAEEFATFLHKNCIEHNINIKKQEQGLKTKEIWIFEKFHRNLMEKISICARKCIDFWGELLQTSINISRLYKKSIRIAELYATITSIVKQMLEIFSDHSGLLKDYAIFLSEVMNNDIEAAEYMEKFSNVSKISTLNKASQNQQNIKYGYNSGSLTLTISGNINALGIIQNSNDKITQFGYSKSEIIGKNISILLPKFLGKLHNGFILKYFETASHSLLDKETILFIQCKSGYIEPIHLLVKCVPSIEEGLCFIGFIKKVATDSPYLTVPQRYGDQKYMVFISDIKGHILGFSKACFRKLGFCTNIIYTDDKSNEDSSFTVQELNSNLLNPQTENILIKEGMELTIKTEEILNKVEFERLSQKEIVILIRTVGTYLCYVQLVKHVYKTISFNIFKIAVIKRQSEGKKDLIMSKMSNPDIPIIKKDQKTKSRFQTQNQLLALHLDSSIDDRTAQASSVASTTSTLAKNVKDFKKQISSNVVSNTIVYLNRTVIILMLLLIGLTVVDIIFRINIYNGLVKEIERIIVSNNRRIVLADVFSKARTLVNIGVGLEVNVQDGKERFSPLLLKLHDDLELLWNIQLRLDTFNTDITDDLKLLIETRSVPLQHLDSFCNLTTVNVSMGIAVNQMIVYTSFIINSDLFSLKGDPLPLLKLAGGNCTTATLLGRSIYFIVENYLGPLRQYTLTSSEEFVKHSLETTEHNELYITLILVFSGVFVLICSLVALPILIKAERNKVIAISVYSKLPIETAKKMLKKCKNYSDKKNQSNEVQDKFEADLDNSPIENRKDSDFKLNDSPVSKAKDDMTKDNNDKNDDEKEDDAEGDLLVKNKAPEVPLLIGHDDAFQNFRTNIVLIMLVLFSFTIIIVGYLVFCYYLGYDLFYNSKMAFNQIEGFTGRTIRLLVLINGVNEMIIRNGSYQYGGIDLVDHPAKSIIALEEVIKTIKENPSKILSKSVNLLKQLDSIDFCDIMTDNENDLLDCKKIDNTIMASGIRNAAYYYVNRAITVKQAITSLGAALTEEFLYRILNTYEMINSFAVMNYYIRPGMWKIHDSIYDDAVEHYDTAKVIDLVKSIVFIIVLILVVLIIWRSFITSLKKDMFRARGILNLIPTEFIIDNEFIRKEVKRVIYF